MEILDQGLLHPLQEDKRLTCPGQELNPARDRTIDASLRVGFGLWLFNLCPETISYAENIFNGYNKKHSKKV
jgi:hypothetical protein